MIDDIKTAWVYALRTADKRFVKVGVADNPDKRVSEIRVGCPLEVFLYAVRRVDDPFSFERRLHQELESEHVRGEWFAWNSASADIINSALVRNVNFDKHAARRLTAKYRIDSKVVRELNRRQDEIRKLTRAIEDIRMSVDEARHLLNQRAPKKSLARIRLEIDRALADAKYRQDSEDRPSVIIVNNQVVE